MGKLSILLVLLLALGGAGAYNYHRNLEAEAKVPRPYRGYSDADLTALLEAYQEEVKGQGSRYEAARSQKTTRGEGVYFDEKVRDFERARERSAQTRALAAEVAQNEKVLRDLEREQALRDKDRDPTQVFLRRLLTF